MGAQGLRQRVGDSSKCVNQPPSSSSAPPGRDTGARGKTLGGEPRIYLVWRQRQAVGCCAVFDKPRDAGSHEFTEAPASS